MTKRRTLIGAAVAATVVLISVAMYGSASATPAPAPSVPTQKSAAVSVAPAQDLGQAAPLSDAQYADIAAKLQAARTAAAANVPQGARSQATVNGAPSTVAAAQEQAPQPLTFNNPGALIIGRNNANTEGSANTCGTGSATPAEPAAANEGRNVYYTGNLRHQEFSTNGGSTYTCAAAYPAGPAEAPIAFGDTDVIYDQARGVTFHSVLYVNATVTNGVLGIFVRRNITKADNCHYFIDFDPTATNVVPDYPHLGLSNNFLYFNANRLQSPATGGRTWIGATMERLSLDQLSDCITANGNVITFTNPTGGQRILVPGHGAHDVMYFSWVDTTSQWRIFSWADNSSTVFSTFVAVTAMTFGTPDCRGGTNNVSWTDSLSANIVGFNVRTTVGNDFVNVWVAVAPDTGHTHAYVRGAMLRIGAAQDSLTLAQEPVVFFTDRCAGQPVAGVNDRGDQGLSFAIGGANGGGGPAVTTGVGMKDEFNPGPGGFFFQLIANATQNPSRYGDYTTVRRNSPCGEYFDSTGYGMVNGTAVANVNDRYVEFGRGRDQQCYLAWRNANPAS